MNRSIIFDLDGTLLDTEEITLKAFSYTLKKFNFQLKKEDALKNLLGKTINECYKIIFKQENVDEMKKAHYEFQLKNLSYLKTFPGAHTNLKKLKRNGYRLGLVTNRYKLTAEKYLQITNLIDLFEIKIYADDVKNHKPHPEGIKNAISFFGSEIKESVMIGDTAADIIGGKNAGIKTIGVLYGSEGKKIQKNNPDYLIQSLNELPSAIKNVFSL